VKRTPEIFRLAQQRQAGDRHGTGFHLIFVYRVVNIDFMELTTAQAAAKLGVTQPRIRQLILAGTIKARLLTPRTLVIDERELRKPAVLHRGKPGRPRKMKQKKV
jgi:hypothetical protein